MQDIVQTEADLQQAETVTFSKNPIEFLVRILNETAQTEEEKRITQAGIENLHQFAERWEEVIRLVTKSAWSDRQPSQQWTVAELVGRARAYLNEILISKHLSVDSRDRAFGYGINDFPSIRLLRPVDKPDGTGVIFPSEVLQERLLKALGVLEKDSTLKDLQNRLPFSDKTPYGKPHKTIGLTHTLKRLPVSSFPGCDVSAHLDNHRIVDFHLDLRTFKNMVPSTRSLNIL